MSGKNLTKSEVESLLAGIVDQKLNDEDDGFGKVFKEQVQQMIDDLKAEIKQPFDKDVTNQIVTSNPNMLFNQNGHIQTAKGSIINPKDTSAPWIAASEEMTNWAKDFSNFLLGNHSGEFKFLNASDDEAGGFLVPEEFRNIMIMYDVEPTLVWDKCTVWPMGRDKVAFPKSVQNPDLDDNNFDHFAGVSFEWTEEGGTKPETEPNFGLIELIVHELAGYTEITNTLLKDSVLNLLNYLTRLFKSAWYWNTDKTFLQGTGSRQPLGIINDPASLTVYRNTASTVKTQDFLNMEARMPAVFDNQSVWFISKKVRAALRGQRVTDSNDQLVLEENYKDFSAGYDMTVLGRPAFLADGKIPAIGSTGDVILGAWPWYYVGIREEFTMDASTHYKFRNNRTALRCSGRVDGQAAIPQAFVILNSALS